MPVILPSGLLFFSDAWVGDSGRVGSGDLSLFSIHSFVSQVVIDKENTLVFSLLSIINVYSLCFRVKTYERIFKNISNSFLILPRINVSANFLNDFQSCTDLIWKFTDVH